MNAGLVFAQVVGNKKPGQTGLQKSDEADIRIHLPELFPFEAT